MAAVDCRRAQIQVKPEIMIPLVGTYEEIRRLRELVVNTVDAVFEKEGVRVDYHVGTMIELPRACIVADEIARAADFFSFGTNDLTQTTWGLSRDDAGRFLPAYVDQKWIPTDPFVALDQQGVGELMKIAVAKGRTTRPCAEDRDLRRTRRRTEQHRVLPPDRARLRVVLAVPRAHRPPCRCAGRARRQGRR